MNLESVSKACSGCFEAIQAMAAPQHWRLAVI
jgi:hypothetical protein